MHQMPLDDALAERCDLDLAVRALPPERVAPECLRYARRRRGRGRGS
jgi:hypothetical protein